MGSSLIAIIRLTGFALISLILPPIQLIILLLHLPGWNKAPMLWHRLTCLCLGITVDITGTISTRKPTLFISNHLSYLDIPTLGGILDASFIAKSQVSKWPVMGWLSRLQKTIFIVRENRRGASAQRDTLVGRLQAGDNLVLFPEGTSTDGVRIVPFKTSLFAVAATRCKDPATGEERPVAVQPVTISFKLMDRIPTGRAMQPLYCWFGDLDLGPHLWQFAKLGRKRLHIQFHPVVDITRFRSRKALAGYCQDRVATGFRNACAGRITDLPGPEQNAALTPETAR